MRVPTELRINTNRKETILDKYINRYLTSDIKNLLIKEEWFMLEEMRVKYVAKLQELEAQDLEVLVQEKLNEVAEKIRQDVIARHNDEVLLANLKVQAIDEMIAEQAAEQVVEPETEVENIMEV